MNRLELDPKLNGFANPLDSPATFALLLANVSLGMFPNKEGWVFSDPEKSNA